MNVVPNSEADPVQWPLTIYYGRSCPLAARRAVRRSRACADAGCRLKRDDE